MFVSQLVISVYVAAPEWRTWPRQCFGSAGALFSDPSFLCAVLSPGENATGSLFFYFFILGEKDGSSTHQATCQLTKWLHDYVAELSTSTQSTLKNLALLRGQQIKAGTGFYIHLLVNGRLSKLDLHCDYDDDDGKRFSVQSYIY